MKLIDETDSISLPTIFPQTVEEARARTDNILRFSISGVNTTKNKNIYYEIKLNEGTDISGKNRFNPEDLRFDLVEIKDGIKNRVVDNMSFSDLEDRRIWVNTIDSGTTPEVNIEYELRMWLSEDVLISDTLPNASYTTGEYRNSYGNVRVSVYGDLIEKHVPIANVTNVDEFEASLANENIEIVNMISNLNTDHSIIVDRDVIINGNNNTIQYNDESGIALTSVDNNYVIEIQNANVTLRNIKITGTDAALLVNSSNVTLSGKIDVSGNKQCGIVVMKDNDSSTNPNLDTINAELINTTEEFLKPTILEENSEQYVNTSLNKIPNINETQTHYYLNTTVKSKWTQIDNFVTKEEMILFIGDKVNCQVDGYNGTWSVLGADEGHLLLISDGYINESFALSGADENFKTLNVQLLHNEASKYGNGYGAFKTRSVTVEDINRLTGYDPVEKEYGKGNPYAYGNEITYSNGTKKSDYYSYYLSDVGITEGMKLYDLILGKDGNASYWLASPFTRTFEQYYNEGMRAVFEKEVQRSYLRICAVGVSVSTESFGVRAVVYIDDSIKLEKISNSWDFVK